MKLIPPILFSLLLSACAHTPPSAESIVGTVGIEIGKPGNNLRIVLECENETSCTFTTIRNSVKDRNSVNALNMVRPVDNLVYAKNALKFAIEHRTESSRYQDSIEAMNHLRPVFSTNPSISKCWVSVVT